MSDYADVPTTYDDPDQYDRDQELLEHVITADELQRMVFPPLEYAIPGVVPEGYSLLSGAPKTGKSWLILDLCIAKATGGRALRSLDVDPGDVLYLALEDGHRRLQARLDQLIPGEPFPPRLHLITRVEPGQIIRTVEAWLRATPGASLIVLDTLGKAMPPKLQGETTYDRDYRVGGRLHHLASIRPGVSLVVVHHTRKAVSEDFVDSSSGTNGLTGAADTVIVLQRRRLDESAVLSVTGRDVDEAEYGLDKALGGSWQLVGGSLEAAAQAADTIRVEIAADRHGDRMREVVGIVNASEVTTPKDVADKLGIDNDSASKYLRRAADKELIDKAGRGLYTPVRTVRMSEATPPFGHSDTSDTHSEED